MLELGPVTGARLASLATGRGGIPAPEEWPIVLLLLALVAVVGTRLLRSFGLTRVESILVAGASPLLVIVDAPLGELSPGITLAANMTGCLIPLIVAAKVVVERRAPFAEVFLLFGVAIVVSYLSSHVVPSRGVMLQYRIPAVVVGVLAAGMLYRVPERAGAASFAAGAVGVVVGADLMHLSELAAAGGAGRIILGGAGLLDGIFLVSVLAAAIAECTAVVLRSVVRTKTPTEPTV